MPMSEFEVEFCSEVPFYGRRWGYNRDIERYEERVFLASLQVRPDKMIAQLDTPAGVGVLWRHGDWAQSDPSIGRALSMHFEGTKLLGNVRIDSVLLEALGKGLTPDALEAGINAGGSIGVNFLDNPPITWKMGDGTREKPDRMTFGAVRIVEYSLTPVPRIYTAGIKRRLDDGPDSEPQETENA